MMVCPDAELLAGLIEQRLSVAEQAAVEGHVAACSACLDVIAAAMPPTSGPNVAATTVRTGAPTAAARRLHAGASRVAPHADARPLRRLAIAAGLTLLATAALGYGGGRLLLNGLRVELAHRAAQALGVQVAIERGGFALGPGLKTVEIRLGGVHLAQLADAAAVALVVPTGPLLRGDLTIERVRLQQPTLAWAGTPPLSAAGEGPEGAGRRIVAGLLAAPLVEIDDGASVLTLAGEPPLRLDGVTGSMQHADEETRLAFGAHAAGGQIRVNGRVSGSPDRLALAVDAQSVAADAVPILRRWLTGAAEAHLEVSGTAVAPHYTGHLAISDGRLVGWNPVAQLAAAIGIASELPLVAPGLTANQLALDDLRLDFTGDIGTFRVTAAQLTRGGVELQSTLIVSATGDVRGSGELRFPMSLAASLVRTVPALASSLAPSGELIVPFTISGGTDTPRAAPRVAPARPESAPGA
jgi:hypothetical protein